MARTVMQWNEVRDAELKEYVASGMSRNQIATKYCETLGVHCTRNMVVGRIWRIGLESPVKTPQTNLLKTVTARRERRKKHEALQTRAANGYRTGVRRPKWIVPPDTAAPAPLLIPAHDLSYHHCKSVAEDLVTGAMLTDDSCAPLYCGHHAEDGRWCEYHFFRYLRRAR